MGKHRIVVSAENNGYIGWQCKLFYYSCVTRTSFQPLFIVHAMGSEWHPDFHELVKAGALVRSKQAWATRTRLSIGWKRLSRNTIPRGFP